MVSSKIVQAYCTENSQAAVQGRRTQTEHDSLDELRGQGGELEEAMVLECVWRNSREKRAAWRAESSRAKAPEISRRSTSSA